MRLRSARVLLVLPLLASCGYMSPAPATVPPTQRSAPAATTTFRIDPSTFVAVPASWTVTGVTNGGAAGVSTFSIDGPDVTNGGLRSIDLATWTCGSPDDITPAQCENIRAFFRELGEAGTFSPAMAARLAALDAGTFFSRIPGDILASQPLNLASPENVAFSYTSGKGNDSTLLPGYHAYLLDVPRRQLINLQQDFGDEVALVAQKHKEFADALAARPADREAVLANFHTWFKEYIESTPRTSLPWGDAIQTVDEVLMSYRGA